MKTPLISAPYRRCHSSGCTRRWPGLASGDLEMGEDLKITTDLRSVLAEMLSKRMVGADIADVFPGFAGPFDAGVFSR